MQIYVNTKFALMAVLTILHVCENVEYNCNGPLRTPCNMFLKEPSPL